MMTTSTPKFKSYKASERTGTIISYIILILMSLIWLYPILWIILNAFQIGRAHV